jgi:hypothetical protein
MVSGEQYRYALTNFRIAHEKVEQQRQQLEEQERQVALLRARIGLLEGGNDQPQRSSTRQGGSSVDDFSIKSAASKLERLINRWAADIIRATPPASLRELYHALLEDIVNGYEPGPEEPHAMQVQNLLRHAMSETISEGYINCLIVTNSSEANVQLTRIHEQIFARDPTVACVWRRQTFSAAVESCSPEMTKSIIMDNLPTLANILFPSEVLTAPATQVLEAAGSFSRMLHGSNSSAGGTVDAFYRAFVPELGSTLYPRQIELVKRCMMSERSETDRVGATIFPGLVKVTRGPMTPGGQTTENVQNVVRRAQVICECAMASAGGVAAPA